ncbi:MAG: hypothetical protein GX033_09190 [Firmicutes bacterium]|nr:hypothetical protein [Bacillota bacterium]
MASKAVLILTEQDRSPLMGGLVALILISLGGCRIWLSHALATRPLVIRTARWAPIKKSEGAKDKQRQEAELP